MATPKSKDTSRITPEEYLERERASLDQKHEYVDGEIFAMVGASAAHGFITANLSRLLGNYLLNTPCRLVTNDLKVRSESRQSFYYPDLVVICGRIQYHDDIKDVVINPTLLIEVLSPSTDGFDRGRKFYDYRKMESLKDYLMISQEEIRIEHYTRLEGEWRLRDTSGIESIITIPSINVTLNLSDIYHRVWEE